jgi:hypothetical protein
MRQPHVKEAAPSGLWWYSRPDRQRVIDAYLEKYSGGRTLPPGFKHDLLLWLDDLSRKQKVTGTTRTYRHWSIPAYELAHGFKKGTLMKRLRELEKTAKKMFPDSVPYSRKMRARLTNDDIKQIQQMYLGGTDAKEIAEKFRVAPSKVGYLCREQKAIRAAERERLIDEHMTKSSGETAATPPPDEMPF